MKYLQIMTKNFLLKEYVKNRKTTIDISKQVKCSCSVVWRYLKYHNIKTRNHKNINNGMYGKHHSLKTRKLISKKAEEDQELI